MRNFTEFRNVVMKARDLVDNVYDIYLDKYRTLGVDNEDEDTSDIYNLLYSIKSNLEYICMDINYDIKSVTDTVIRMSEHVYNISSYVNDGIGGQELKEAIDAVDKIADSRFFYVDESVYCSMIIDERSRPEKEGNEIIIDNIWMDDTTKEAMDEIFYPLYEIGYLSRLHRVPEEYDDGVILDIAVYIDKVDDLIDFLNTFTRYAYTNCEDTHDNGWDFRNIIRTLSEKAEENKNSRKYRNFELVKYLYNDVMYGTPNPFRALENTDDEE